MSAKSPPPTTDPRNATTTLPMTTNTENQTLATNDTTSTETSISRSTVQPSTSIPSSSPVTPVVTTSSDNSTEGADNSTSDGSMPMAGLIGIIAGSCVVLFIIIIVGIWIYRKRRRRRKREKARAIPKLPSAADVNNIRISFEKDTQSAENVSDQDMYINIGKDGAPTDQTNPNLDDQGYLTKTSTGVSYQGEEPKKKKKKKPKNKFKKKNKDQTQVNDGSEIGLESRGGNNVPRDQKTESALSDVDYSEGRPADEVNGAGRSAKGNKLYENTQDQVTYENLENIQTNDNNKYYHNLQNDNGGPTEIYENT